MRVLVVGAGIAGLTVTLGLVRDGHRVVLIEKNAGLRSSGYMIDFFGPGFDAAELLGLLPELESIHYPIERLVFVDPLGHAAATVPYPKLRHQLFRDRHFNFMRGELEQVLHDAVDGGAVTIRFGTSPVALETTATTVVVKTSDGGEDEFDVVVGADGVHSTIRRLVFSKDEVALRHLGCRTAAYVIPSSVPGVLPNAFVSMTGAGLTAGVYPIRGGRTATFFIFRSEPILHDRSPEVCRRQLDIAFRGKGWILDRILDGFTEEDLFFDDVVQVEMESWSRGRVVLVGDACGCVSLVAGQGASMAVAGAYVLAQELNRGGDVARSLRNYEERIRPAVTSRQRSGRRYAAWFLPKSAWKARLRDRVTGLVVKSPLASLIGRSAGGTPVTLA